MSEEIKDVGGEGSVEEKDGTSIISRVKTWSVSAAMAAGIALGSAGTYQVTSDKYDPAARIETAQDSLRVEKNIVSRPYVSFDTVVAPELLVGKTVRYVVFIDNKIFYEQNQTVVNPPRGDNDAFCISYAGYIREDRTKIDSAEIKPKPELERE
jgi:hypothetical protein